MTTAMEVTRNNGFVLVTARGRHSVEQGRESLREIARVAGSDAGLLLDVREAASRLSLADIRALVEEFAHLGLGAGRRTAIVSPEGRFDNVHFFAVSARSMGLDVQAFTSLEDATEWLTL
jgi:hypothetical protein